MILYPNCKINLGLNIVGKRTDGYHDIETLFLPIPLCDCLEITPAHEDSFVMDGRELDCSAQDIPPERPNRCGMCSLREF